MLSCWSLHASSFLALVLIYVSFFLLIIPIDWWRGRRGLSTYGLSRAGRSWKTLVLAGIATAALVEWPVLTHTLVDTLHPLGAMAPWRQAFFTCRGEDGNSGSLPEF